MVVCFRAIHIIIQRREIPFNYCHLPPLCLIFLPYTLATATHCMNHKTSPNHVVHSSGKYKVPTCSCAERPKGYTIPDKDGLHAFFLYDSETNILLYLLQRKLCRKMTQAKSK